MRLIVFSIIALFACSCAFAPKAFGKKLDVLIVTDDRKFNRESFWALFESFENVHPTEITHPEVLDFFGTDSIRKFDAIVFYDMPEINLKTNHYEENYW